MTAPVPRSDDISNEKMSEILEAQFAALDPQRTEALAGLQANYVSRASFSAREEKRLARKYGKQSPRVLEQALRTRSDEALRGSLSLEVDLSGIDPPTVEKEGYVFHGFVRNPDGEAVPGMTVALYDREGKAIRDFGHGSTNERGYFLLRSAQFQPKRGLAASALVGAAGQSYPTTERLPARIYVLSAKHFTLHIEKEPLYPQPGAIDFRILFMDNTAAACAPPPDHSPTQVIADDGGAVVKPLDSVKKPVKVKSTTPKRSGKKS